MNVFWALLKKELAGYFKSGTAYVAFLFYLFLSIGVAFYFGLYFQMYDTALYALFAWQPIILIIIVPALSMRTWTEEYKSGTDEFLLTQPLSNFLLVAAKFAAVYILLSGMLLGLLPLTLYTAKYLHLDFANVVSCFVGLDLAILLLSSLGCLISSLQKQMMTAYLCSVFFMALWVWLPFGYFMEAYENFLLGEIGAVDVLYFMIFSAVLLILNIAALFYQRTAMQYKKIKFMTYAILLLLGAILSLMALHNFMRGKFDVTTAKIYTPKLQTEDILSKIEQPIKFDVYVAEDYLQNNPKNKHFFEQTMRFIRKYETLSAGLINVEIIPVKPFSALEENILRRGLYFEENMQGSRNYFGAFLKLSDGNETVIKQFLPQRQAYAEKDIDTAILKLIQPELYKKIGVYVEHQQNLEPFTGILLNLENDYNVRSVAENTSYISPSMDLIILLNPKKLSKLFLYALDQYVMNGGNVLIFLDIYTESQPENINSQPLNMESFLDSWGIHFLDYLADEGKADNLFVINKQQINLRSALVFNVDNKDVSVQPVIAAEQGLIGAILSGRFKSHYAEDMAAKQSSLWKNITWRGESEAAKVAVVSDVDLLDDANWVDEHSSDKNPYSLIVQKGNGEVVRTLVDFMLGHDVYYQLPINAYNVNEQNIAMQIEESVYQKYKRKFKKYEQQMLQAQSQLYQKSGGDENLLKQQMQVSSMGEILAQAAQKIEQLKYAVSSEISEKMYKIVLLQLAVIPLGIVLLLWLSLKCADKRRRQRIKEKFND